MQFANAPVRCTTDESREWANLFSGGMKIATTHKPQFLYVNERMSELGKERGKD